MKILANHVRIFDGTLFYTTKHLSISIHALKRQTASCKCAGLVSQNSIYLP